MDNKSTLGETAGGISMNFSFGEGFKFEICPVCLWDTARLLPVSIDELDADGRRRFGFYWQCCHCRRTWGKPGGDVKPT